MASARKRSGSRFKELTKLRRDSTVAQIAKTLREYRALGYTRCFLRVRTVAFYLENAWHNFATSGILEVGKERSDKLLRLRSNVCLYEHRIPVSSRLTDRKLSELFFYWRTAVGAPERCAFQQSVSVHRRPSDHRCQSWPTWQVELSETGRERKNYGTPEGPFLHDKEDLFGPNLGYIAALFLDDKRWASETAATNRYELLIPDRRARLADVAIDDEDLTVFVERTIREPMYVCTQATSDDRAETRHVARLGRSSRVSIKLKFSPAILNLWVTLSDGYALDHYLESTARNTWGGERHILAAQSDTHKQFFELLRQGESQTLEFKPYVRFERGNEKRDEILESVCAFANAAGGRLLIGVDKNGVPVGVEKQLPADYGGRCGNDDECLKQAYERALRKLVGEGLTHQVEVNYHWRDVAHHWIVELHIARSSVGIGLRNGTTFRRMNATNYKLPFHEWQASQVSRGGVPDMGIFR